MEQETTQPLKAADFAVLDLETEFDTSLSRERLAQIMGLDEPPPPIKVVRLMHTGDTKSFDLGHFVDSDAKALIEHLSCPDSAPDSYKLERKAMHTYDLTHLGEHVATIGPAIGLKSMWVNGPVLQFVAGALHGSLSRVA